MLLMASRSTLRLTPRHLAHGLLRRKRIAGFQLMCDNIAANFAKRLDIQLILFQVPHGMPFQDGCCIGMSSELYSIAFIFVNSHSQTMLSDKICNSHNAKSDFNAETHKKQLTSFVVCSTFSSAFQMRNFAEEENETVFQKNIARRNPSMKKLFALLLCLMMVLPMASLAEEKVDITLWTSPCGPIPSATGPTPKRWMHHRQFQRRVSQHQRDGSVP